VQLSWGIRTIAKVRFLVMANPISNQYSTAPPTITPNRDRASTQPDEYDTVPSERCRQLVCAMEVAAHGGIHIPAHPQEWNHLHYCHKRQCYASPDEPCRQLHANRKKRYPQPDRQLPQSRSHRSVSGRSHQIIGGRRS
jgi:hypothetical protein